MCEGVIFLSKTKFAISASWTQSYRIDPDLGASRLVRAHGEFEPAEFPGRRTFPDLQLSVLLATLSKTAWA